MYMLQTLTIEFFETIEKELLCYMGVPLIWAGDFNCVLDGQLDRYPAKDSTKHHMTRVTQAMKRLGCMYLWQMLHPGEREYSCATPAHGTYCRLDRILVTDEGSQNVLTIQYQASFLSDLAPLIMEYGHWKIRL